MLTLSERQKKVLCAIIEEYIETSEPVGSDKIVDSYHLDASPATVRNDMVVLTEAGFLKQPHTSAGRVPTTMGLRFYIKSLMDEEQLEGAEDAQVRESLYAQRFEKDDLLRNAVLALAERTHSLSVAALDKGRLYYAGQAYMLDYPAFWDIELARFVLSMLDKYEDFSRMFSKDLYGEPMGMLIGNEISYAPLRPCSIIYTRFKLGQDEGTLSVVGPRNMRYQRVLPSVRYFKDVLDELSRAW